MRLADGRGGRRGKRTAARQGGADNSQCAEWESAHPDLLDGSEGALQLLRLHIVFCWCFARARRGDTWEIGMRAKRLLKKPLSGPDGLKEAGALAFIVAALDPPKRPILPFSRGFRGAQ